MTIPVPEAISTAVGSSSMPVTITMPTGTVASDLVILIWNCDGTGSTVSVDAGDWTTNILRNTNSNAANAHASLITWNTGVTAASTVDATCNDTGEAWRWRCFRFSNWNSASAPEISNVKDSNNDDVFDAANVTITPSWGSATVDTLILMTVTGDQTNFGIVTWPTEFPDNRQSGSGASESQIFHASDDTAQATWTPAEVVGGYSSNTGHTETLIAIRGTTAGSGGTITPISDIYYRNLLAGN